MGSDAPIGLTQIAPNAAGAGPLGAARRASRHRAIVCVTRGGRPGLCPSNADAFEQPFGPPVVQVSSEDGGLPRGLRETGSRCRVRAQVTRTSSQAVNVVTQIAGADGSLPPLIVMTPAQRLVDLRQRARRRHRVLARVDARAARGADRPAMCCSWRRAGTSWVTLASTRSSIAGPASSSRSAGWMHFGANIGAAQDPATRFRRRTMDSRRCWRTRCRRPGSASIGAWPGARCRAEKPSGHRGGGRYVSIIGRNALFHNQPIAAPMRRSRRHRPFHRHLHDGGKRLAS
jgi:hypothetical protein